MPEDPATTRRGLLGGALAAVGLTTVAGCDLADLDPRDQAPGPDGRSTAGAADVDGDLVAQVRADLAGMAGWTAAVAARFPGRSTTPQAFTSLHRAHRAALAGDEGRAAPTDESEQPTLVAVPRSPGRALRLLREREQAHQRRLVQAATTARSGALARLLASMSAAVAQQLAHRTGPPPSAGGTG